MHGTIVFAYSSVAPVRKNATLKELSTLVAEGNEAARKGGTRFNFGTLYMDNRRGMYLFKDIGSVTNGAESKDDGKTLQDTQFQIGDLMSVSLHPAVRACAAFSLPAFCGGGCTLLFVCLSVGVWVW